MRLGIIIAAGVAGLALAACSHHGDRHGEQGGGHHHGASIADNATMIDWDGHLLRAGSNGWTCLPDNSFTDEHDPWCIYGDWDDFLSVFTHFNNPGQETIGVAYMRAGDPLTHVSPGKRKFKVPHNWQAGPGDWLIAMPPAGEAQALPTDPSRGGAWIMWPGTPFEHVMVPRTASR